LTLNITLAGPTGIHQATDFRLMRKVGQAVSVQSDASPKMVGLTAGIWGWDALVTYAGLGALKGIDTSSWLNEWLKHPQRPGNLWPPELPDKLSFDDMIQRVRTQGTNLLSQWSNNDRRHTFVIGAFVEGKPQVVLLSNYEHFAHDRADPAYANHAGPELLVSRRRPRTPKVVVTGTPEAVPRTDRRLLRAMARASVAPKHIRHTLANVIRRASASYHTIGPAALTYSLTPNDTGGLSGGGEWYGDVTEPFVLHEIFVGIDNNDIINMVLQDIGSQERIQTTNCHG
jgi:hypothetical protein